MAKIDLSKYGITGATEIVYNPSYELLFEEETKSTNEGYEVIRGRCGITDRSQISGEWGMDLPEDLHRQGYMIWHRLQRQMSRSCMI